MPTPPPLPPPNPSGDDAISTLIPYRNVPALFAYYCGVFALIPCIGVLLGLAALILGIVGLKTAARQPSAKGRIHAWVGIVLGSLVLLAHAGFAVFLFVAKQNP